MAYKGLYFSWEKEFREKYGDGIASDIIDAIWSSQFDLHPTTETPTEESLRCFYEGIAAMLEQNSQ